MENLHNGYTLQLCDGAFPLSTDSIALSGFIKLPKNAQVLDLGSGCGTLGLLLCAKDTGCAVTGVELDRQAHETALHNAVANNLTARLHSICADINDLPDLLRPGSFDCCMSNPPYFTGGPKSKTVPNARREDCCSLDTLCAGAAWALRYGGDLFVVHRPERLAQICSCASNHQLQPKRLQLLRHQESGPIALILLQCRKGGKPGLIIEEQSLYDRDGNPTAYYKELYHL